MKMNHNNMTLAQHTEFLHLSANRPLEFLSDEVMSKIHKIINNTYSDTIGTIDVLKDFLSLYTHDEKTEKGSTSPLRDMLSNSNSGDKNAN